MTTQVPCPRCRHPLVVEDAYLGGIVRCPDCRHEFTPQPSRPARPADPPSPRHGSHRSRPRPRTSDAISTAPTVSIPTIAPAPRVPVAAPPPRMRRDSSLPSWLILGGFGLLTVVLVAILGIVWMRDARPTNGEEAAAVPELIEPEEEPKEAPEVVEPKPAPMPVRLAPEEIYRRLLKSTVYVVAKSAVPASATPTPPTPPPMPVKTMPKVQPKAQAKGKTPPPKGPDLSAELVKSVWMGTEDLAGFGKLRFDFCTASEVVVRDAKDTAAGKWKATASTVKLEMAGSEYVGQVNGDTILGTARSKQGGVEWKFAVNRKFGVAPTPLPLFVTRTGTGVLIDAPLRLVVTDLHVVGDAEFVEIAFPKLDDAGDPVLDPGRYQSDRIRGQVIYREPRVDLVLVRLEQLPPGVEPLPIAEERVQANDVVHLVGNPGEKKTMWFYRPSKIRAVGEERWEVPEQGTRAIVKYDGWRIEAEGTISPGDSGGPLVSERGELVGVAHAGDVSGNRVSFFIEASEVRGVIGRFRQSIGDPLPK